MKKILALFLFFSCLFLETNISHAAENPTKVTFIYINGSNNLAYKNRLKFKVAFIEDVNKMHPEIKKRFENDTLIKENFLKNGQYVINPEPIAFYWGDKSLDVVEVLDRDLKSSSKYSPKIAHQARSIFAHCLHDAVWVQKPQNMTTVLNELHQVVSKELAQGNKVVLLGYSAGSFVTYQYYMNKANTIIPTEIVKGQFGDEIDRIIESNPIKPTCFSALTEANLIKYNSETGLYNPNPDINTFKKNYANLDTITQATCFVGGDIKGVIGFASPARLFYSDLMNSKTSISNISHLMARSIVENDVFYLTVNYKNDPFGFANANNFTLNKLKQNHFISAIKIKEGKGFIYNKSDNYVPRTFITAHLAYWDTPKRFAKAIVKAFNEGYLHFYELNNK